MVTHLHGYAPIDTFPLRVRDTHLCELWQLDELQAELR